MSDDFVCCFVNAAKEPLKVKSICYFTTPHPDGGFVNLHEVVEETYPHPDAPSEATVNVLVTRCLGKYNLMLDRNANINMLDCTQKIVSGAMRSGTLKMS